MRGGVGTQCKLRCYHSDGPPPVEGDFLRTRTGTCYRIDRVRESTSGHVAYVFTVTRLGKDAVQFDAPGVCEWIWAKRPATAA